MAATFRWALISEFKQLEIVNDDILTKFITLVSSIASSDNKSFYSHGLVPVDLDDVRGILFNVVDFSGNLQSYLFTPLERESSSIQEFRESNMDLADQIDLFSIALRGLEEINKELGNDEKTD
jgi:hypothetical protein